jgi:hypothetical protein
VPQVATTVAACTYTAAATGSPALMTHKHFVIKSFLPAWAQKFVGSNLLTVSTNTPAVTASVSSSSCCAAAHRRSAVLPLCRLMVAPGTSAHA